MDQRHVQYYRDLIAKNPDKKDLILDGAYALYSSGNKFDAPPDLDTILNYGKQYQADQPFEITKGLKSKTQSMQGFLHGAVGLAGDMVGSDTIRDYGYEGYKRNMTEAQGVAPRVGRVEDINSIGDASDWLMGTIGGLGPDFGEMLATTFIGGMAGSAIPGAGTTAGAIVGATSRKAIREVIEGAIEKQIGKKIASGIEREVAEKVVREEAESLITREIKKAAGKKAGLVLGVAPLEAGGMYGKDADERGIENANPWSAAVLGTASAMTESSGAVGDLATNGLKRPTKSEAVKSYLSDSFGEAGQELVQTGLGDVNRLVNNPDAQISGSEYLNAGAGGFVGGSAAHLPSLGLSMARKDPKAPQDIIKSARGETGAPIKESPVGDGTIAEQEVAVLSKPGPIINSNPTETMGLKAPGATVPEATPFTKGLATGGIAPQSEIETPAWVDDQTAPITGKGVGLVVPSVQPMPVEEQPAVNAGLPVEDPAWVNETTQPTEQIKPPSYEFIPEESDLPGAAQRSIEESGYRHTIGQTSKGIPAIFTHDIKTGKLEGVVTYKTPEEAEKTFVEVEDEVARRSQPAEQPIVPAIGLKAMPKAESKKPAVPAKGLSLDQDEFGGMGLPVYESKGVINESEKTKEEKASIALPDKKKTEAPKGLSGPLNIPVNPQINMAEELKGEEDGKIHSVPNTGVVDNMKSVGDPINKTGNNGEKFDQKTSRAKDNLQGIDVSGPMGTEGWGKGNERISKPVDERMGGDKPLNTGLDKDDRESAKEPFKAPEGVKLTSTGGPFKISGAKKAVANHTKRTGEAAEVVDLGGGNYGWKVSDKKENRTLDSVGRVKDGVGIKDDEVFTMASGRKTTPYPKYTHLKREAARSLKSDQWLIENAVSEAKERGDDFNGNWINRLKPGKLSPSDYDSLNMYLFDGEMDKILSESKQKKILRPLVVNETPVDDRQTDLTLKDEQQKEPPISKTETTGQRKTEKLDWFVNYTERENTGRTTEIKRFGTLRDAEEFANGKYGYITRTSDGGSDYDLSKSKTKLIKYFGGFEPSAQEVLTIKNITRFEGTKESDSKTDPLKSTTNAIKTEIPSKNDEKPVLNDEKADQPSVETVTEPVKAESSQEAKSSSLKDQLKAEWAKQAGDRKRKEEMATAAAKAKEEAKINPEDVLSDETADGEIKLSKRPDGKTGPTATVAELSPQRKAEVEKLLKAGGVNIISNNEAVAMLKLENADVRSGENGKVQGFVLNGKVYIILENIKKNNLWNVIRHEVGVHMGQLMQGRPEFNRILKTIENLKNSDTKQGELVRKAFDRVPKDTKPEHITEEALAYLVESAPEIGIVRRFITMVKRLLVKMGVSPMIFNQADYAALADAAIRKEAGRVSGAGKMMEGMGQFAQDAKMSIEKAKMAIQNLPAFKKWFGDSKVVDEDGGPLVVYHGTSYEGDIGVFDTSAENQLGTHFAPNKDVAVAFTGEGDGMIHEAYISVKNPYDIVSDLGDWSDMGMLEEYLSDGNDGPFTDEEFSKFKTAKDVQNGLIKKGYDGVKYENSLDIKGEHVSYIVFSPTQIKSIFNTKWNPENPDIMMSKRQISEPLYSISDAKDHVTEAIDDGIEYVKNLYERRGEIKPALQGAIKYRNEKGPGDKTDVSYLAKAFGLISHFSKSIPAMARTFNAALRNSDIKTMVEQQLTHGADGEKFIQTIDRFRRKMKDEYNRLDRYLHNRDLNQIGYRVKELDLDKSTDLGGKYVVIDLKHKETSHVYETENEAWEKVMDLEAEDYIQDGGSQGAANILKLFRTINNRSFDLRISRFREVEQYCRDHGVEIPKIVYEEEGKEIQVDLKQKLIEMGDRRGYYMPRIRKPGEHMLYAKKDGSSPIMKFYDLKTVANMAKGSFESKGYTVTVRQAGNLSEDLFEQLGSILSQQALINESMKEINKGNRVVALKDLDIKSEMDGDTLVLSGDFKDEFIPTLEKRGGVKKVREHVSGKTKIVTIEYRFENAKKNLEEDLSKELFKIDGVTNLLQDVALRFAGAFVSQYADVIRSRDSRSAMIGRSDKVGDEVTLGFEEDVMTRVVRATLSLAGGEAKSRTALSMIEAITGRDIKWAKFSEIKRFKGTFEEFEKQAIENDEQYIDRATFEEIKNKWDGEPQYLDYIEFLDNRGIDPGKQKNAHSESISLFKDIMRNDERVDRFVGTIQGLAVLKFLAFRVSSPAVNLLNMVVAVPAVMNGFGKIPLRKTYKLIANAYKDYVAFTNNTLENKEMVKVFSEIEKRGWGKQTLNQEGIRALQNKLQFGYSKMLETSMMLFAFTEKLNRVGTIAATYKGLLVSMPNLTFEERLNKAHEISNDAHGIYGKANRPSMIRGGGVAANVLQMGYVFKVFMHQFLSTMYRLGFVEKERTAALYMAFFPAIFGLGSSIGAKAILTAMSLLPGSDDPEEELYKIIESRFGTYAGNFSRFGVFGMFGNGISVKGSMEVGGISDLPSSFKDFVGAPGAVFTDISDGLGELTRGNGMKAAEKFLPTGLGAPVKAYREYTEGITTKSNAPVFFEGKPLKADAIDAFLRALSFNPSRIAGAREKLWGERASEQAFMERRKDIYSRVKKYYLDTDRDPEDLQDIEIDIAAYNQRAKNSGQTVIKAKNIKSILKRAKIEE